MAKFVESDNRAGIYITDYRDLIKELNKVQPTLVKQLRTDFKEIAKPVQQSVKKGIPTEPPTSGVHKKRRSSAVSGFEPRVIPGRLTWGANSQNRNISVKSVKIDTPSMAKVSKALRKPNVDATSIARLKVDNAAVVMADMAGKSKTWVNKRVMTREYKYSRSKSGVRRHRVNGQGVGMIDSLTRRHGKASRFAWPSAEKAVPLTFQKTKYVLEKAYARINRKMSA